MLLLQKNMEYECALPNIAKSRCGQTHCGVADDLIHDFEQSRSDFRLDGGDQLPRRCVRLHTLRIHPGENGTWTNYGKCPTPRYVTSPDDYRIVQLFLTVYKVDGL